MCPSETHVTMGRVGRSHGVTGWMKVHTFTEPMEAMLDYQPWYIDDAPLAITASRAMHDCLLIKCDGCDDPDTVRERYTNRLVTVMRSQLPETAEDEYYWHDLIGCQVVDEQRHPLGVVTELMRTPGNDVLVVQGDRKHLIPWTRDAVPHIKIDERQIIVDSGSLT